MFSVLLSLYIKEQPAYFIQCMESLFSQTLLPDEVVLVKDGPLTAELDAIIADYAARNTPLKVVPLSRNQGLGNALNEGLKHCSYDLVARMDTDDIAKPQRFRKQMEMFEKNPELDVCGTWIDEFEENTDRVVSVHRLPENHEEIVEYARKRNPINHPVVMFRKSAVQAAGGYLHFPLFEDYYLWVRMLMNGAKFYNIQESLLYFRFSSAMFKRRGGWKYAVDECRFQKLLWKKGFLSGSMFVKNVVTRIIVRLMPNSLRTWIYKKLLR